MRVITLHSVFPYDLFQLLVLLFKECHEKVVIFYFTNSRYSCKFVKNSFNKTLKLTRYCCREKTLVSLTKSIQRLKNKLSVSNVSLLKRKAAPTKINLTKQYESKIYNAFLPETEPSPAELYGFWRSFQSNPIKTENTSYVI